jgi:hypothetical protein
MFRDAVVNELQGDVNPTSFVKLASGTTPGAHAIHSRVPSFTNL